MIEVFFSPRTHETSVALNCDMIVELKVPTPLFINMEISDEIWEKTQQYLGYFTVYIGEQFLKMFYALFHYSKLSSTTVYIHK